MISVKNLCKNYCGYNAVDNISFNIKEGSVTGLLGPNGAGKTTTMRMLTGYLAPTSGTINIFGTDLSENPIEARKNIGYLPEIPPLYPDMTVKEHLSFVCDLRSVNSVQPEIDKVCTALDINDVKGRMIRHLSKGYRQRVGFAAALVGNPKFLILDEPTVGLDPEQVIEIRNLIHNLSEKMSILISSHMLGEISSVCDSLLILKKGKLVASGSREQIEESASGKKKISVSAVGDKDTIEALIYCAVPDCTVKYTGKQSNKHNFTVTPNNGSDCRGELFRTFASRSKDITLVDLHSMDKTLEEVFLDIIREG